MTVLIIDGMDRCGKSSVARGLIRQRVSMTPLHMVCNIAPPMAFTPNNARQYQLECYKTQLEMASGHGDFIIDRSWLSEEVYGQLYRGQPRGLSPAWMSGVAALLKRMDHLLVVLTDEAERVVARSDGDSMFHKPTVFKRVPEGKEREYALDMAFQERLLFAEASSRARAMDIRTLYAHGMDPKDVLEKVSMMLGW